MRLDTITTIEQFMVDSLLSSPQIPLGVNVIRLAATTDEEGIAALTRSIVVRYTGSSMSITNRRPLTIERTLRFELIHSSQSYLSESGHDAALQMCAGAYLTLNDQVPMRAGVRVLVPLAMNSESFDGLTDSSHYVYIQNWEVTVLEINPTLNQNPCVLQGNCSELFPYEYMGSVQPGDVIYENRLFSPLIPPFEGNDYDEEYCGVVERDGNLYFRFNPDLVFLSGWENYELVSTDTFLEGTNILICNIKDPEGNQVDTYFAANCDKRGLLALDVAVDNEKMTKTLAGYNGMVWMAEWPKGPVFMDPTEEDGNIVYVKYGFVMRAALDSFLYVDNVKYIKVQANQFGTAWVKEDSVKVIIPNRYEPIDICLEDEAINEGPQSCE